MSPSKIFAERTFLEHVSLAAREPVYSAAIAWLLGERSPVTLERRSAILGALIGQPLGQAASMQARTEWKDVDVLVTVYRVSARPLFVAIENKIKASEGTNQLATYDGRIATLPGDVAKVFLTLAGEAPRSGRGWRPVSYATFARSIGEQCGAIDDVHVRDFHAAITRLVAAIDAVRDPGVAANAFDDEDAGDATALDLYVDEMRLKKVAQRAWMLSLCERVEVRPPWRSALGETRGQALLNIEAAVSRSTGRYRVGLQLQRRALKAFGHPDPYPECATPELHDGVSAILDEIRSGLRLPSAQKVSPRKARGFRSITIHEMPRGRDLEQWRTVLAPHVMRFAAVFPAAEGVKGTEEVESEDE